MIDTTLALVPQAEHLHTQPAAPAAPYKNLSVSDKSLEIDHKLVSDGVDHHKPLGLFSINLTHELDRSFIAWAKYNSRLALQSDHPSTPYRDSHLERAIVAQHEPTVAVLLKDPAVREHAIVNRDPIADGSVMSERGLFGSVLHQSLARGNSRIVAMILESLGSQLLRTPGRPRTMRDKITQVSWTLPGRIPLDAYTAQTAKELDRHLRRATRRTAAVVVDDVEYRLNKINKEHQTISFLLDMPYDNFLANVRALAAHHDAPLPSFESLDNLSNIVAHLKQTLARYSESAQLQGTADTPETKATLASLHMWVDKTSNLWNSIYARRTHTDTLESVHNDIRAGQMGGDALETFFQNAFGPLMSEKPLPTYTETLQHASRIQGELQRQKAAVLAEPHPIYDQTSIDMLDNWLLQAEALQQQVYKNLGPTARHEILTKITSSLYSCTDPHAARDASCSALTTVGLEDYDTIQGALAVLNSLHAPRENNHEVIASTLTLRELMSEHSCDPQLVGSRLSSMLRAPEGKSLEQTLQTLISEIRVDSSPYYIRRPYHEFTRQEVAELFA